MHFANPPLLIFASLDLIPSYKTIINCFVRGSRKISSYSLAFNGLHSSPPTPRRCARGSALSSRQIGLLLHTTLTFISFCYCKTVIYSLCAISGWVRLRSHGALRKIQKKSLIFLSGVF